MSTTKKGASARCAVVLWFGSSFIAPEIEISE